MASGGEPALLDNVLVLVTGGVLMMGPFAGDVVVVVVVVAVAAAAAMVVTLIMEFLLKDDGVE